MSIDELAWGENGLLPVVIQDAATGAVLTLAYADREALRRTLAEKTTWLYSRSRGALWKKGETSGHTQTVASVAFDCDADALLYRVEPHGPACHTGAASCFGQTLLADTSVAAPTFERAIAHLRSTIAARRGASPESSYTARLLHDGVDRIGKKIGEEATEVVIAAKNDDPAEIAWEVADLLYHTLVLLEERGVALDAVGAELLRRAK
ncbi:MAG: bifunctional phosphoribosyl-AMP cyclohydrolase/phosphoribosyl-ATP diphosphatase HisIE [Vulcanimicrobiaceae bacterium]